VDRSASPHLLRQAPARGKVEGARRARGIHGEELWCMAAMQANHRARGVRASVRLGDLVWASYGPNWAMDLKEKLEPIPRSTILIKEPWSLGFYISG
jgi:hypothetical protein